MRSLTKSLILLLAVTAPFSLAIGEEGGPKIGGSIKPSILHGSAEDITAPAVKFDASLRYNLGWKPRDDFAVLLETKGAVATDARANSDNLFAALHLGYSHQFADWDMVATTNRTSDSPNARPVLRKVDKMGGLLDLFLKGRFETDQPFENYNITYGPHLGFSPLGRRGFTWLVPACYVDYLRVDVLHSRRNERLGIGDDSFWRFDASAGWRYPFGEEWLQDRRWFRPLGAEFDLHYYHAFELPAGAKAGALKDGLYYAGTLNYNLRAFNPDAPRQPWWKPYYAYVTVGRGRLPPVLREQTSVYVGLVYSWGS